MTPITLHLDPEPIRMAVTLLVPPLEGVDVIESNDVGWLAWDAAIAKQDSA